jgi:hypothetical protein
MVKGQDKRMFPVLLLPNEEGIMEKINGVLIRQVLTAVLLVAVNGVGWATGGSHRHLEGTLTTTTQVVPSDARCNGGPGLRVVGAGNTNPFGSVYVQQCHCLGPTGFFDGFFKLTKKKPPVAVSCQSSSTSLLEGRYCGSLVETFNSVSTPPPPLGTWLIAGYVCITDTILGQVNGTCIRPSASACKSRPIGYDEARGFTDLSSNTATIFLDQDIHLK